MIDYYKVLDIARSADSAQIKAAYKRLAKRYHPDHNPGDRVAEERFKEINEAYHVLTDPIKKSRYDTHFSTYEIAPPDLRREPNRMRYYKMRHAMQPVYRIDHEYFKIQALTILVFIVIAGFCLGLFQTASYLWNHRDDKKQQATANAVSKAKAMFLAGDLEKAITFMDTLSRKNPDEFHFIYIRDSLLRSVRTTADESYDAKKYAEAIIHYKVLAKRESTASHEILYRIAFCQYYLGNYREALVAMKHLYHQNPNDLTILYNIGIINLDYLESPQEAILYFNLGEKKFKENLTALYGENFADRMKREDVPDIYYNVFVGKAHSSLLLRDYTSAEAACDWAIHLRPDQGEPFALRAISNIKLGNVNDVCRDLRESKRLQHPGVDSLLHQYCAHD